MAVKTNKSMLDKVQNMALRVILGAVKATLVHDMKKKQQQTNNKQNKKTREERKPQDPHSR